MRIRLTEPKDKDKWNDFCVNNYVSYGGFHEWQSTFKFWGYEPLFVLAEDEGGEIGGILPLIVKPRLPGVLRAYSPADTFDSYMGPIVNRADAIEPLLDFADGLIAERSISCLNIIPSPASKYIDEVRKWLEAKKYLCKLTDADDLELRHVFRIPLSDFDSVWKRTMGVKVRNQTRKAVKQGVKIEEVEIDRFCDSYFPIQREVWKRLGNICPSLDRLKQFLGFMKDYARMYLAVLDNRVVGGLFCFYVGKVCFLKGAISYEQYSSYCINNLLYSHSIEQACNAGLEYYDMGSTPSPSQSGHHHWKSQYGGKAFALYNYKKVYLPMRHFVNGAVRSVINPLAHRISYGGVLSGLLGSTGRALVDWIRS